MTTSHEILSKLSEYVNTARTVASTHMEHAKGTDFFRDFCDGYVFSRENAEALVMTSEMKAARAANIRDALNSIYAFLKIKEYSLVGAGIKHADFSEFPLYPEDVEMIKFMHSCLNVEAANFLTMDNRKTGAKYTFDEFLSSGMNWAFTINPEYFEGCEADIKAAVASLYAKKIGEFNEKLFNDEQLKVLVDELTTPLVSLKAESDVITYFYRLLENLVVFPSDPYMDDKDLASQYGRFHKYMVPLTLLFKPSANEVQPQYEQKISQYCHPTPTPTSEVFAAWFKKMSELQPPYSSRDANNRESLMLAAYHLRRIGL